MENEKFNPYPSPDLISAIKQDRLKLEEKNERLALTNSRLKDAIDIAEAFDIPVSVKPIGGRIVVFQKGVAANQPDSQPERQKPNEAL